MTLETRCIVKSVGSEKVNCGRRFRNMVVVTEEIDPQVLKIIFRGDKNVGMSDGIVSGDRLTLRFSIRGREWLNPGTGQTHVFNTLEGENVIVEGRSSMQIPSDYEFTDEY